MMRTIAWRTVAAIALAAAPAHAQDSTVLARGDSVLIRIVDVDLRAAVSLLARYLDHPVTFGNITGTRVTLESPRPVPQRDVQRMLKALVESQNLEFAFDSAALLYRVKPKEIVRPTGPPGVQLGRPSSPISGTQELFVVRLRHARAADVAAMVNVLFGRAAAIGELGGQPQTLGQDLRQNVVPPVGSAPPQAIPGAAGRNASLAGEITIVPDPSTNSLLIRSLRVIFS